MAANDLELLDEWDARWDSIRADLARGWPLVRLNGKIPNVAKGTAP